MGKVYLYVHDEKAYGHLSRMLKIYHVLSPYYDVCILLGGKLEIHDSRVNYIKLPYATEFEPMVEDRSEIERNLKKRRAFIKDILQEGSCFSVFLDYFPFGRHAFFKEIDMIIDMAKMSGGNVYSVMRDIYSGERLDTLEGYLKTIADMREYFFPRDLEEILFMDKQKLFSFLGRRGMTDSIIEILLDYYLRMGKIDALLIFGDEKVYDFKTECPLSSRNEGRFIHLGYLLRTHKKVTIENNDTQYVLVSVGGNIFDMKKFLSLLLACSKMKDIRFKIVIGSMLDVKVGSEIQEKFQYAHMEFIDFSEDIDLLMRRAKVFIGSGGYGTCMDLIQYNIPGFLYLNYNEVVHVNKKEQYTRIQSLSRYIDIEYVTSFTPEVLRKIALKYYQGAKSREIALNISGGNNLLEFLGKKN